MKALGPPLNKMNPRRLAAVNWVRCFGELVALSLLALYWVHQACWR